MEAEQEVLQERIDNWQKYLDALREKWEEQQHLEDERLLQQLLNAENMDEVYQKISDDMEAFNIRAESGFDEYAGIFDNFIAEYRANLEELQELSHMQIEILNTSQYLGRNNVGAGVSIGSVSLNGSRGTYGNLDLSRDYMQEALDAAASGDLDKAMALLDMRNEKVDIQHGWDRGTNADLAYERVMNAYNSRGYAEGIENGPVEETGLAMLHGTPSSPEYVLNTEQAGQLLENLATTDFSTQAEGTETVSQADESTATTGVTGNARTELEGINKIISQMSAMINHEALTNSNLTQIAEILRMMNETNGLIQQIVSDDLTKDESRYAEFKEILNGYFDQLLGYLDGYNDKLDTGNTTLNSILDGITKGFEALNSYLSGLADKIGSLGGSLGTGNYGSSGSISSGSGSSSRNYYSYNSDDYLADAIKFAKQGNQFEAYNSLWNRANKVSVTKEDYGTNYNAAQNLIDSILGGRSYAEGIENGPVTETGPAMLHGSETNPEYVLNSDQAGQLIENLATTDLSEDTRGTATVSQADENTATTGVTGNARTELEGINKIISQISALINQEALTNSNLTQIAEILRNMNETNNLIQQIVASDVEKDEARYAEFKELLAKDEARYAEFKELLAEYYDSLIPYLDGFNEKLDTGNATLNSLLDAVNQGIESLNEMLGNMMNQINSLGSQIGGSGLGLGSGSSGGSSSGDSGYKYYYSEDYLQDAIDRANSGNWEGAMESLWNRDNKIHHTKLCRRY